MTRIKITNELTDEALLAEIGERLAQRRITFRLTQAGLAERAGVSKRTIERVEAGHSAQLESVIRIFRVLELVDGLEILIPAPGPTPMDLLQRQGRARKRAFTPRGVQERRAEWTWSEDT